MSKRFAVGAGICEALSGRFTVNRSEGQFIPDLQARLKWVMSVERSKMDGAPAGIPEPHMEDKA